MNRLHTVHVCIVYVWGSGGEGREGHIAMCVVKGVTVCSDHLQVECSICGGVAEVSCRAH